MNDVDLALELRCRNGGDLLEDEDIAELVRLARRLGSASKDTDYLQRRSDAMRFVQGPGQMLRRHQLEAKLQEFELDEDDVRDLTKPRVA